MKKEMLKKDSDLESVRSIRVSTANRPKCDIFTVNRQMSQPMSAVNVNDWLKLDQVMLFINDRFNKSQKYIYAQVFLT